VTRNLFEGRNVAEERLVYLVDDDAAIRRSAGFMLRTSGYQVRPFESGVAFLKEVKQEAPGVILLDVRMPGLDGLEVQQELHHRGITQPVIVLTGHGDISVAVRAMKAGALDFFEKPFQRAGLLEAVERGLARLEHRHEQQERMQDAIVRMEALSPREREVLHGLACGHPNKTIAYDLGISPRTVEIHRANVMTKLEVQSLSEALRVAFAAGFGSKEEAPKVHS
jgi:two-component system response regulator FixJ